MRTLEKFGRNWKVTLHEHSRILVYYFLECQRQASQAAGDHHLSF